MVKDIDDMADDLTRGISSAGDEYFDTFLSKRPKDVWAPYIDETAKDVSSGIQISDIPLSKDNFGKELGTYYARGLKRTTGRHADLPSVLDERVSDEKLGLLAFQLNEFSYDISNSDIGIDDIESATEAVIEKILTRHLGDELSVTFDLSGATVSDITTQLFKNQAVASNVDILLNEFEESAADGLLSLMDEPQMMTPLWEHQRTALNNWFENGMRGYVDMATATGKTVLGLAALALQYGELHPDDEWIGGFNDQARNRETGSDDILIVAHSDLILEQWRREFENHLNIPQDRTSGGEDIKLEWGTIHFRTPQSLVNKDRFSYELVLLDEAHHYATGSEWGSLLDAFEGSVMAMSGSVDDAGADSERIKERLENSVGPLAKRYTITEARDDGVIPSFDWEVHYAPYDVAGDELKKGVKLSEHAFNEFKEKLSNGDLEVNTNRRLRTYEDIRNFSHTSEGSSLKQESDAFRDLVTRLFSRRTKRWNLSPVLDAVVDLVVQHHTTENVVVLADSNAQVEELDSRLQDIVTDSSSVYLVSGSQSRSTQREVIDEFDEPESTGILLGTGDLLGEGVDMQHASVAINMATGGVNQELVQRIGRVLRNPDDTPKHAMFYNVVGVPPSREAAVSREDGKQILEQAAGFCSLGHRFDKLPGFSISDSISSSVISELLLEGAKFIGHLDSEYQYSWNKDIIQEKDLRALFDKVEGEQDDAKTILGKWEEYAWENSKDTDEINENIEDGAQIKEEEQEDEVSSDSEESQVEIGKTGLGDSLPRKEKLLAEIKDVVSELGEVPSKSQMESRSDYSIDEFEDQFGTWSNAVRDAGFEPLGSQSRAYTREDVIDGLKNIAESLGKSPGVNDINNNAEFSASVVYNYFESIGDARKAADVEEIDEGEISDTQSSDVDSTDATLDPNPLSEHYELFYRLQSLLEDIVNHSSEISKVTDDELLEKWETEVNDIVFGDGPAADSSHYAEQQSSRNSHTMKEYRKTYGNGEKVTAYQCVDTSRISDDVEELLEKKQIIEMNEQIQVPVAPDSGLALPIIVSDERELEKATELINEFPAEPSTEYVQQSGTDSGSDTISDTESQASISSGIDTPDDPEKKGTPVTAATEGEKFWDNSVESISEYEQNVVEIKQKDSSAADSIDSKINEWKSQVLDLTRGNNLISFSPTQSKSLPIEMSNPVIVAHELANGEKLYFRKKSDDSNETEDDTATKQDTVKSYELTPTREEQEARESLANISRRNKNYIREQGVDLLYISLGMLEWYSDDHDDEPNLSPLFLVPVKLEQTPIQDSDLHNYIIKSQSEGVQLNPALRKKLSTERNIDLPADGALSNDHIDAAFKSVNEKINSFDGWQIKSKVVVGIFDFSKYSIYSDLERNRSKIKSDPIIQALDDDMQSLKQAQENTTTPSASELDAAIDPVDTYQVLDADSSQQEAIEAAKRGKSFVLQGPPGTGKSQTIANIISEKLAQGERILFVSEKQAALNVVKTRLDDVGLGGFCLEIHGEKANNENILGSLETELRVPQTDPPENRVERLNKLKKRRDAINQYGDLLFTSPGNWDLSVYQIHGIVSKHHDTPRIDTGIKKPLQIEQTKVDTAIDELKTLSQYSDELKNFESSPWRHTTLRQWSADTGDAMRRSINQQIEAIGSLSETADNIESELNIQPESLSDFYELINILQHLVDRPDISWKELYFDQEFIESGEQLQELADIERERSRLITDLSKKYQSSFFSADGAELNGKLSNYGSLRIMKPGYRSLKKEIINHTKEEHDPNHEQLLEATQKLTEIQQMESQIGGFEDIKQTLGPSYDRGNTDWDTLISAQEWVAKLSEYDLRLTQGLPEQLINDGVTDISPLIRDAKSSIQEYENAAEFFEQAMAVDRLAVNGEAYDEASLSALSEALNYLLEHLPQLQQRVQFLSQLDTVRNTICGEYVDRFLRGEHPSEYLVSSFKRGFYSQWLKQIYDQTDLDSFASDEIEGYLEDFRQLDEEQQRIAQVAIQNKVTKRRSTSDFDETPSSEQATVRRQIEEDGGHKPLRELFDEAGKFITQLTPCFMMSPLSVAKHLKSESIHFDTVVFDEASQIMPQDAVSSLIRADQAIIAGDSKQLPPTVFFESEVETKMDVRENLDSILEETASVLPEKTLQWHYRSQSKELIKFSNKQYYNNDLRTFPENNPNADTGVSFEYVEDGVCDCGGSRQNKIEAERVVDLIEEHADQHAEKSLGVVAFSSAQEQAIRDAMSDRRNDSSAIDEFMNQDDALDEFFVKNVEMVQGDERDRIIFSVGYGPDQDGKISTNFGPLNRSGGERRLNVAITRAKEKITVVCSMQPEDIDLSDSKSTGAQHLKEYLEYLKRETEVSTQSNQGSGSSNFDFKFEEVVYDELQEEGHDVVSQVQNSSYSYDLAIKHPSQPEKFVLGIECDGSAYHSSKTARDRDRTRQFILENLGWNIHRIWSPDWVSNKQKQLRIINEKIESIVDKSSSSISSPSAIGLEDEGDAFDSISAHQAVTEYQTPSLEWDQRYSPDVVGPDEANKNSIEDTVANNGPIKYEAAIRTYLQVWSESKITEKVQKTFNSGLRKLTEENKLFVSNEFLWPQRNDLEFKLRVNTETASRSIDEMPLEEIAKAGAIILEDTDELPHDVLVSEIRQSLKFNDNNQINQRIEEAVNLLDKIGIIRNPEQNIIRLSPNINVNFELLDQVYE